MSSLGKYTFLIKASFCLGILYWLTQSGKLDLSRLSLFYQEPQTLVFHVLCWGVGFIFLNSLRWKVLLKVINVKLELKQATKLTAIGLFFNSFLPGSVSGDGVKAYYIIKKRKNTSKTALLFSVLLDRVLAFYGLFMVASFSLFFSFSFDEIINLKALTYPLLFVFFSLTLGFAFIFFVPLKSLKKIAFFRRKAFAQILSLIYHYRHKPYHVLQVLFYALLTQGLWFLYFSYITSFFNDITLDFHKLFIIYPLGLVSTIIPIAPGGLGVGHATYDALFHYFQLKEGANVFNIFFIGSLCLNLLGLLPYLLMKKGDELQ